MKLSIWDILTIVVVVATVTILIVVLTIFTNPDSSLNPFPLPTLPPTIMVPSPTATQVQLPPTWTPGPTAEIFRFPSSTPIPTMTPLVLPNSN